MNSNHETNNQIAFGEVQEFILKMKLEIQEDLHNLSEKYNFDFKNERPYKSGKLLWEIEMNRFEPFKKTSHPKLVV